MDWERIIAQIFMHGLAILCLYIWFCREARRNEKMVMELGEQLIRTLKVMTRMQEKMREHDIQFTAIYPELQSLHESICALDERE